ncbi:transcriptional regulator, TetR family [Paraburkholderia caballeronis]|uniref:Transcriptional regulator, TetR family n=1 Tax=Paraburkholderia caballeronis TaxID=416943 RepID=A0A1H7SVN7_9BURK|nr:TetR family transcriptional regulator [Paraburkholderia caballeronis]PXX01296.1 TetR family transcriptional regulator [Paraburkholderia caballeronis]RAJ99351.1 TetR family transcriptional regulator [Paraburkholderia caballeronis]SEE26879.1 transcriptional regulator, TetR family [Paraburkholderia caballeronis]SEL76653.1 transcriptional regulator, TetR family [Paraburkholderia caballeronis]
MPGVNSPVLVAEAKAVKNDAGSNSKEKILAAATTIAQAHGYGGLNFRDLADAVGIKAASIYHHFTNKADLGAAVARRYWQDSAAALDARRAESADPLRCLRDYPDTFRKALQTGNRICLCSFMAAESDDLPEEVLKEVRTFADVNVAWLAKVLSEAGVVEAGQSEARAGAIFAAVAGAQLVARSRSDLALYDMLIDGYRAAGLLPS